MTNFSEEAPSWRFRANEGTPTNPGAVWFRNCSSKDYLAFCFATIPRSVTQISKELGYKSSAFLSAVTKGRSQFPLERLGDLAKVVPNLDPALMGRKLIAESYPRFSEYWKTLEHKSNVLSKAQLQLNQIASKYDLEGTELTKDELDMIEEVLTEAAKRSLPSK